MTLGANNQTNQGRHVLPPLPYEYDALEPYISERTMRLHHDVHHRAYVDGLNRAEEGLARARRNRDWTALNEWERRLAFHGSGHFLHNIFWTTMHPNGGGRPTDEGLMQQIEADFGSFDAFRAQFTEAANQLQGSGWVLLVWQPMAEKLEILQTEQHHYSTQWTTIPVLVLDLWEHAYYLQYQARRADYVESWWNVVNWPAVARRLREAQRAIVSGGVMDDRAPEMPSTSNDGGSCNGQDGDDTRRPGGRERIDGDPGPDGYRPGDGTGPNGDPDSGDTWPGDESGAENGTDADANGGTNGGTNGGANGGTNGGANGGTDDGADRGAGDDTGTDDHTSDGTGTDDDAGDDSGTDRDHSNSDPNRDDCMCPADDVDGVSVAAEANGAAGHDHPDHAMYDDEDDEDDYPPGYFTPPGDGHAQDGTERTLDDESPAATAAEKPTNDVTYNSTHMVDDEAGDVKTIYGTRSTIRRALRGSAVKGGTMTRTGTVRNVYGRRSPSHR